MSLSRRRGPRTDHEMLTSGMVLHRGEKFVRLSLVRGEYLMYDYPAFIDPLMAS